MLSLIVLLVAVSAILHLRAEVYGPRRNLYFFKPLTMILIILIALQSKHPVSTVYKYLILGGLFCSLAGDIFLMLPADKFINGLVSFLFAHLFYIAAFTFEGARTPNLLYAIPFLIYGTIMMRILVPGLGNMKAPVMIYMLIIIVMAWQALNRWAGTVEQEGSALAFAGAMLFVASDSLLAVNRFRKGFRGAQVYIMSTYFMAQLLIALST